jgi:hypothetical protein
MAGLQGRCDPIEYRLDRILEHVPPKIEALERPVPGGGSVVHGVVPRNSG